ncbi:MAG: NUDIX hydrolase [Leptospiraceae bacterium]|nr:MAG: NUDIX hydrolase [Leptospiraceae bacterium]
MEFKSPMPCVDIIIEIDHSIVIIERKHEPLGFALPGGFVDPWESIEHAAIREAKEETLLDVELYDFLYTYSDPKRDKRLHTISSVFIAKAKGSPRGADDAKKAFLVPINDLLKYEYAFDHKRIISDYIRYKEKGIRPNPKEFL